MNHQDHVQLLEKGIENIGGVWADLGSGEGAFTLALRDICGPEVTIYSVDKDEGSLKQQQKLFEQKFPDSHIKFIHTDFTHLLNLPSLDGIVMANSLHFIKNQHSILKKVHGMLKPNRKLLLVEYNVDEGNAWVPYPLSYKTFETLANEVGFTEVSFLTSVPSSFLREIYSACAVKPS